MSHSLTKESSKGKAKSEKIWTRDFSLIVISNFFIFLGFQMTLPTIPLFVEKMGGNDQLMGLVVGVFTFSALLVRPYAGIAVDSKGRRFIFLFGLSIFILSVGSYGLIYSILILFIMRVIQGIGWGFSTTASGTIATDLIPPKKRGEGMGYFGLSGNIAMAFGPSLGLFLADAISFSQLFFICAALGLMALLFASKIHYKEVQREKQQRKKWDIFEKSAVPPAALIFFITVTFGGIASFLPIYTMQKDISGIYLYFLLYATSILISRVFAGRLYDLKGHKAVFIPGSLLIISAMFFLSWLPNSIILYIAAILYGLGFGTVQPALQAWAVREAVPERRGMANATFFSFFDLGIGTGAIAFGQIAHIFGYASIYKISAFSVFLSIVLYLFILRREKLQKHSLR